MADDSRADTTQPSQLQGQATPPPKRKRTSKATNGQFEELVRILEARPFLATRRFTGLEGKENFDVGWREVAQELNKLRNGAVKTDEQWMTVWRDLKSRVTSKAAKLKRQRVETGNRDVTALPLTELEKRVVSIVCVEYTTGTNCPDAMPEEEAIQRDLEGGIILVIDDIDLSYSVNNEMSETQNEYQHSQPGSSAQPTPTTSQPALEIPTAATNPPTTTSDPVTNPSRQPRRNRGLNPRRSVTEEHNSARGDFLAVAETNANAMKMLAEANKIQAEAAKVHAEALKLLAEAANRLCAILENRK